MRKILTIIMVFLLVGCSSSPKQPATQKDLYQQIIKLEAKMKKQQYFKINKYVDEVSLVCDGTSAKKVSANPNPIAYSVAFSDGKLTYVAAQKMPNENQTSYIFYKDHKVYYEHSQMMGTYSADDASAEDEAIILDPSIPIIDTRYEKISKKQDKTGTIYTVEMKKPKKYNKAFPADYDDATCGLVGDYVNQKIVINLNTKGLITKEVILTTINYHGEGISSQRLNTTTYDFYDFKVKNDIDFSFINNL